MTGQYGLNANYAKATDIRTRLLERTDPDDTDYSRTVYETNSFQISGARVLLGLSMYF